MLKIVSFLLFFVVFAVWLFIHTFIYKNMTLDQQFILKRAVTLKD